MGSCYTEPKQIRGYDTFRECRTETPEITKKFQAGKVIKSCFKDKMHQFKTELILIAQLTPQYAPTGVNLDRD